MRDRLKAIWQLIGGFDLMDIGKRVLHGEMRLGGGS